MKIFNNIGRGWSWLSYLVSVLFAGGAWSATDRERMYIATAFSVAYLIVAVLLEILWELKQQGKILRGEF